MPSYSFDEEEAQQYGVNEAIFLNSIRHWIRNDHGNVDPDGIAWVDCSVDACVFLFPWWNPADIENIISILVDKEVIIISGSYPKGMFWLALIHGSEVSP